MRFILMHGTVTNHDAIGNDIEGMFNILNKNHECAVFAVNKLNDNVRYIDEASLEKAIRDQNTVIIYHHSFYWKVGYEILQRASCKIIIKYHNITPDSFFWGYNQTIYDQCRKGRALTKQMEQELPGAFWLCDSQYNASELSIQKQYIGICPPFNKIESWSEIRPDEAILRNLADSDQVNVLFVGRIVPNKSYLHALEIIRLYCLCYDQDIIIRFVGKFNNELEGYNNMIKAFISLYDLEDNVQFIGETSDKDLLSYYLGSDLMLCCSQHEGFCVPVIEAQHLGLPVIALKAAALPETMGENQLCMDWDDRQIVSAIRVVSHNAGYATFLRNAGMKNYNQRFSNSSIREVFLCELERGIQTI